jgi:hypothetical protein
VARRQLTSQIAPFPNLHRLNHHQKIQLTSISRLYRTTWGIHPFYPSKSSPIQIILSIWNRQSMTTPSSVSPTSPSEEILNEKVSFPPILAFSRLCYCNSARYKKFASCADTNELYYSGIYVCPMLLLKLG